MKRLVHLLTNIHCEEEIIPHLVENHYEKVKILNDFDKEQNDDAQYSMTHPLNNASVIMIRSKKSSEQEFHTIPNPTWNKDIGVNVVVRDSVQQNANTEVELKLDESKKESELYATRFTADEEICGNQ